MLNLQTEVLLRWFFDLWRNTILHLNFQSSFDNIPLLGPYKKGCLMSCTKLYYRESASYLNPKDLQYSCLGKPLTSPYRHHFFFKAEQVKAAKNKKITLWRKSH